MIYLLRHGQTEFNREGRLQGRLDSPLTELGIEQARRMGRFLSTVLDAPERVVVLSSPLGRARRTAEIVCQTVGLDCEIQVDDRLAELGVGRWEGLTREDIEALAPGVIGTPGWLCTAPGGEGCEGVSRRVRDWLDELDETDGRLRVVVSHGVTGRFLRGLYVGAGPEAIWAAPPPPQDSVHLLRAGVVGRVDDGWTG